jgi:hypothetical protein
MLRNTSVRALVLAIATLIAAVLAFPGRAFAGTLQVRDEAHVLSPEAVSHLRSIVASAPFDARLAFTSEYDGKAELARYVRSLIHEPNMIAVGVDREHRHVEVHFGTGSGIARSEWPSIEGAGDAAFRSGNWEGGAASIFKAAERAAGGAPLVDTDRATQPASRVGSGLVIFVLVIVAVGAFAFFARRRSGYGGYGPPGYGPGPGYGGPPYAGPSYGPPPGQGMGPLGGGLIGAGLGGLAGYELGKMEGEREERERDRFDEDRSPPDDNFDAGGGGSSWGDDDGGGGGFDGGGGDSGGGSDF